MSEHHDEIHHHISPIGTYLAVFAALMVLTFVTVMVAGMDLGKWNTFVALAIAVVKATVVILWFMHMKYSAKITWICVIAGTVWIIIMLMFTMMDFNTRVWSPYPESW